MAITRLQQARQMYALGQRVGGIMGSNNGSMLVTPTRDGSRPGYYGPDAGHANDPGHGSNSNMGGGNGGDGADTKPDARDAYIAQMYTNVPTAKVTVGEDKFGNPIEIKTTYREKIKRAANLAALNAKGISSFDPRVNRRGISPFGFDVKPVKKDGGFWSGLGTLVKNIGLGIVAPQLLAGTKLAPLVTGFNTVNRLKSLNKLVNDLNITDVNVIESLKSNLTSPKSTKSRPESPPSERDGTEFKPQNENPLLFEYLLLLNKGLLSAEEQGRFNSLKSRLGKAEGGIMDVNMNKGQLGETLYG